jgi:CheY-like chemotaxis protein
VLVVDDNGVNRTILQRQLSRWGMAPTAVNGGQEALEALGTAARERRPYELAFLDVNMPGMTGWQLAAAILQDAGLCATPIVMLTSAGLRDEQHDGGGLGVSVCLPKPASPGDLLDAIGTAVPHLGQGPAQEDPESPPAQPAAAARRVLLVEDNAVNQRVAAGLLTRRGHHVTVVGNGRDAVERVARESFDLALMDLQMPVMGGLEATALIRDLERGAGRRLRIVAMTAHAMSRDRDRCLAVGMDGYLSKPIDKDELYLAVEATDPAAVPGSHVPALSRD